MKGIAQGFVRAWGRRVEVIASHFAGLWTLLGGTVGALLRGRVPFSEVVRQMHWMGVESIPIVLVTSILAGFVTSQQGGYQFTGSIPLYILGSVVTSSMVLELGPVLTAIILIGRVGARITAELGTMRVSEQIDAMMALDRDPVRILGAPRVIAGTLVFPVLVAIANFVGIAAGMVGANLAVGLGSESFLYGARLFWYSWDLFYSLGKGVAFGFAIPLIAVHMGLRTHGGAEGVGLSTTRSVIFMLMVVLFIDAAFPPLFLN